MELRSEYEGLESVAISRFLKYSLPEDEYGEIGIDIFQNMYHKEQLMAVLFIERPELAMLPDEAIDEIYDNYLSDSSITGLMNEDIIERITRNVDIKGYLDYQTEKRLFVDMDGTLSKFEEQPLERLYEKGYFRDLEPNETFLSNLKEFIAKNPDVEVFVLSNVLYDSSYALREKEEWLNYYLPEIDDSHRIFPPCTSDTNKADYIPDGIRRTDILIDDYSKNLFKWERSGGKGLKIVTDVNNRNETWIGKHGGSYFMETCSVEELQDSILNIQAPKLQPRL